MLRACACLPSVLLASGCSPGDDTRGARVAPPETIVVDGRTVDVASLTEAVAGLCQARREAATDARVAKSTYDRRSHHAIDTITQLLQPSYAPLAGSIRRAAERVQGDAATEPVESSLADDLGRLTEFTREGLARLGVTTRACQA
ncbi:MAG: hypothetical protein M3203_02995 [Actinomycetota bacterium]|nr:hypothetical protein [Actinomycetota bacterium]